MQSKVRHVYSHLAFSFLVLFMVGCGGEESGSIKRDRTEDKRFSFRKDGELAIITPKNDTVVALDIEYAKTDEQRQRGMMFRKEMGDEQGMLFFMDREEVQSFWMKNCYLSLDMIFADKTGTIVSAQTYTEPYSLNSYASEAPAQYVLEVKAGFWDKHNIQPGYKIVYQDR